MSHNYIFRSVKYLSITFVVAVFYISCSSIDQKNGPVRQKYTIPDTLLKKLTIATVKKCPLLNILTLTSTVDFDQDHQVNIYPMVSGNIQDVKVQVGDHVNEGQTLALIRSSEMAGYSNNLVVAETNLTVTKKQLDATKDLYSSGLASQLDVTNAQANYEQAEAQLLMIKRVLKINGNDIQGNYIIKSPISGFVVQKNVTNNTAIRTDNGNNIFTISDLKNVWVQANVYESNISKVHMGDSALITTLSYPDRVFKGKIDKIVNVLDPTTKVMKVRVIVKNEDYALKPLMFASVSVINKENSQYTCIPKGALIFDHSRYFVLAYKNASSVTIRPVEIHSIVGDTVYLDKGIEPGEQVIATQAILIYDTLNN